MSSEGDKNLDNDAAGDLLSQISDELFARIIELLQHPGRHEYDDEEIGELFVRIEMIFALHDRGMIYSVPEQKEIGVLVGPFLERWKVYHRAAGHEPPSARLRSMEETFVHLIDVVRSVHAERSRVIEVEVDWESDDLPPEIQLVKDLFDGMGKRSGQTPKSE